MVIIEARGLEDDAAAVTMLDDLSPMVVQHRRPSSAHERPPTRVAGSPNIRQHKRYSTVTRMVWMLDLCDDNAAFRDDIEELRAWRRVAAEIATV